MKRPLTLVMDLTERCNLSCVMCYFANTNRLKFHPFDRELSKNGNMPVEVFEELAEHFFNRAWRVALGCAAEPMIHSKFADIVRIAGRYGIEDLWFPTNLLALTPKKAEAIVEAKVRTVAVSMDGTDQETYEKIRIGGKFSMLLQRLDLMNETRKGSSTGLRIIYTWMRSNRDDILRLPEFAERYGVRDLDVRFVTPTVGVDNGPELLDDLDRQWLSDRLAQVAEDAVSRGIKLAYYPEFQTADDFRRNPVTRLRRALWRWRAGLYRPEYFRYRWQKRLDGCAYPKRTYVIRPNGAVNPCIFWEGQPMGVMPADGLADVEARIDEVREGLRCGKPIGTCSTCNIRRDAFYQPFKRPKATTSPEPAEAG
ncbi:MAG: radical SAM protein [Acidobacteriota bacterium]